MLTQWCFWILLGLLLIEVFLSVQHHSILCGTTLANTLLLVVCVYRDFDKTKNETRPLFQRMCGCVAFVGLLFVSVTHCFESLTDSSGHEHSEKIVTLDWALASGIDIAVKVVLILTSSIPPFGLSKPLQFVLHLCSPIIIIITYLASAVMESFFHHELLHRTDAILAILTIAVSFGLIIPAFTEMKPYIFVDTPDFFESENFQNDINQTFSDVRCSHIHVYRLWPGNRFEALIHIDILVDKSDVRWIRESQHRYEEVCRYVRSALTKGGAQKVIVEPRFVSITDPGSKWIGCVAENCFKADRGCCKTEITPTATTAP